MQDGGYETFIISTIVDMPAKYIQSSVYEIFIISTIVDPEWMRVLLLCL